MIQGAVCGWQCIKLSKISLHNDCSKALYAYMTLPVLLTEHFLGSIGQCVGCGRGVTPIVSVAVPTPKAPFQSPLGQSH